MIFGESFLLKSVPLLLKMHPFIIRKAHVLVLIIIWLEVVKVIRHGDVVGERKLVVLKIIASKLTIVLLVRLSNPAVMEIVVLISMKAWKNVR